MGVSSLIDLEQTQEENQRKRGNSEAGLLSDVLFTPAALIFLNPKDSPWAAAPGQDTGTARSPTDMPFHPSGSVATRACRGG